MIVPPRSKFGTITPENRQRVINSSLLAGKYDNPIDRDSAYEYFQRKYVEKQQQEMRLQQQKQREVKHKSSRTKKKAEQSLLEKMASSAMRSMSSQIGRQIGRGILGSLSRK